MRLRRGVGRTEVLIGAAVIGVLGLIAVPLFMSVGKNSSREEVPLIVESLRRAELFHFKQFGEYVAIEAGPRSPTTVGKSSVPWKPNPGFTALGWDPGQEGLSELYGSYRVSVTDNSFKVTGTCDVDGDGERATFEATVEEEAKALTPSNVY
jgi:hypothetical protein